MLFDIGFVYLFIPLVILVTFCRELELGILSRIIYILIPVSNIFVVSRFYDVSNLKLHTLIFVYLIFLKLFWNKSENLISLLNIFLGVNLIISDSLLFQSMGCLMIVNTFDDDKKVDEIDHLAQSIILSLPIFLFFWRGGFSTNLLALELKQNDLLVSIFSFLIFLPSLRALLSRKLDDKDIVWSFVIQSFFYFLAWKTDFIKLLNENQLQILKLFALFQLILFAFKLEINNSDMVKIKVFVVFNQVLTFFGLLLQSDLFLEILFFNGLIYLSILYMDTKLNLLSNIVLFCLILIVPFTPWFELKLSIFKAAFMSSYDLTYLTVLLLLGIQLRWGFLLFCKFIKAHLFDRLKAS